MTSNLRRFRFPLAGLFVVSIALALVWWKPWRKTGKPAADLEEIARLNNRGVGLMEQMSATKYQEAAGVFQEIVDKAPDWRPGRINLGIALLNTAVPANLDQAITIFKEILATSPDDPYAHYNLGIILVYRNENKEAAPHFEAVTKIDPQDAHAWYNLGMAHPKDRESPEAKACLQRALKLNPYLNAARYALAMHPHERDDQVTTDLLAEKLALENANWEAEYRIVYTEMGKYAEVIGRTPEKSKPESGPLPAFADTPAACVELSHGVRWATRADVTQSPSGPTLDASRGRSGGAMTLMDFDRDGRPDVFLPMAVVENGRVGNLLLHNEGGKFRDLTKEFGLSDGPPTSTTCVGDFDNDGFPDLFVAGPARVALYRNLAGKGFADVTTAAGLDKLNGHCHACLWTDIDQDGDLDLALAFASKKDDPNENGLVLMLNVGEAPPGGPAAKAPAPLKISFKRCDTLPKEVTGVPVTHVLIADLDGDHDIDLLVTSEGRPRPVFNDRLLRFHVGPAAPPGQEWFAGLAITTQPVDRSDILMLAADGPPMLLTGDDSRDTPRFLAEPLAAPRMRQAMAFDLDLDGKTDVLGLSAANDGKPARPVLLHNEAGKLVSREDAFGAGDGFPDDLLAIAAVDVDGDCQPDLLCWSAGNGLNWRRNLGNGNRAVRVEISGRRDKASNLRTNTDGIGSRVWTMAGTRISSIEHATLASGPGQSLLPLTLGIGKDDVASVVRIRWPDGVAQAELDRPACEIHRITELNRKETSCPVLLTWDGERFVYVTDLLGGGAVGEMTADGSVRSPRPEESVRIPTRSMRPKDGHYVLKLAEPMDEVMYLDRARLTAIDHPRDLKVFPDERFATSDPPASQELLAFREWHLPKSARNHLGKDVTARLRENDGLTVNEFTHRSWLGFAEEHRVELEFPSLTIRQGQRWFLVLSGWTDYPYPESIFAADQAGVKMQPPLLERSTATGDWETVGEIGFPAGLPKTMTAEVTGKLPLPGGKYRIRTNLQIYWDQIALAPLEAALPSNEPTPDPASLPGVRAHHLKLADARLTHRGFMRETPPANPTDPPSYDDSKTEPVAVAAWKGRLTRTGDVTELVNITDDRHVICGPGDEVTMRFVADLPPLPAGWERTFVLRSWGYCKDTAPFTGSGGSVHPLPFRAMPKYPYGAEVKIPDALLEYDRQWNTRKMRR